MSSGVTFRRCSSCRRRVPRGDRACTCGSKVSSWYYVTESRTADGKRTQKWQGGFTTQQEAADALSRLRIGKADGTLVEPSKLNTGAYLTEWLVGKKLRSSTRTSYSAAFRKLTPLIGDVPLQALTRSQVKAAYGEIAHVPTRFGKPPSAKTLHLIHLALHSALTDALDDGKVSKNVADRAHPAPKAEDQPEMKVWTAGQIRDFLASWHADDLRPLFWLSAFTGMRRGEVLGLRWSDLNMDEGFLSVRQQIARSEDHAGAWAPGPLKTPAGRRRIDLDPDTIAILRTHRAHQLKDSVELGAAYDRDADLVFARADGQFHDPDSVTAIFEKLVRKSGLPRIRLHDLRHSHATILLLAGVAVHLVAQRLGHRSPMVTLTVYAHVIPGGQSSAAALFADAIGGRS